MYTATFSLFFVFLISCKLCPLPPFLCMKHVHFILFSLLFSFSPVNHVHFILCFSLFSFSLLNHVNFNLFSHLFFIFLLSRGPCPPHPFSFPFLLSNIFIHTKLQLLQITHSFLSSFLNFSSSLFHLQHHPFTHIFDHFISIF